jgi:hypothetical protein
LINFSHRVDIDITFFKKIKIQENILDKRTKSAKKNNRKMRDQYFFSCLRTKQFGGKGQICFAKGRGILGEAITKKKKKLIEKYQKKDNSLQLTHTHTHAHTKKNSLSL